MNFLSSRPLGRSARPNSTFEPQPIAVNGFKFQHASTVQNHLPHFTPKSWSKQLNKAVASGHSTPTIFLTMSICTSALWVADAKSASANVKPQGANGVQVFETKLRRENNRQLTPKKPNNPNASPKNRMSKKNWRHLKTTCFRNLWSLWVIP